LLDDVILMEDSATATVTQSRRHFVHVIVRDCDGRECRCVRSCLGIFSRACILRCRLIFHDTVQANAISRDAVQ
jgi:hypothetical protein